MTLTERGLGHLTNAQRDVLKWLASTPFGQSNERWWGTVYLGTRKTDGKEIIMRPQTVRALAKKSLIKLAKVSGDSEMEITSEGRRVIARLADGEEQKR